MTQPEFFSKIPLAYELSHSWGRFIVSSEANKAYDLVPLREKNVPSPILDTSDDINVILLGPGEDPVWETQNQELASGIYTRVSVSAPEIIAQNGLRIICSFINKRSEMIQNLINNLAKNNDTDPVSLQQNFTTPEGVPITEHLAQKLGTDLIHQLYMPIKMSVLEGERLQRARNHPLRHRFFPIPLSSITTAQAVADEVHNDYCTDLFDQQYGRLLKDS